MQEYVLEIIPIYANYFYKMRTLDIIYVDSQEKLNEKHKYKCTMYAIP